MFNTRIFLLLAVCFATWTDTALAQIAFSKTYGGSYEEDGRWMEQVADSGFILVGNTATYSNFSSDIWLVRTDLFGNQLWTRSYDGNLAYDFANCVKVTNDGGFVIAGFTSDTSGSYDGYIIRTDRLGNTMWQRKIGNSGLQEFEAIIQTTDGNFTAIGIDYGPNSAYYDMFLARLDAQGNVLWTRTFGGASYEIGNSLQQTPDGGYVVTGQSYSYQIDSTYLGDYILYKLDSAGNLIWRKNYDYVNLQEAHYVQNTPDGGFILVGDADGLSNTLGQTDIWLIKTDSLGNIEWTKVLGGTKKDGGKTVELTRDGGYVVGGISRSFGLSEPNYYMAKLDSLANLEWQTYTYGTLQHDHLYRALECSDGGYAMFGYFRNTSLDKNFALVKVGPDGGISNDVGIDKFVSPAGRLCKNFGVEIAVQITNFGQRNIYNVPVTVIIDDSLTQVVYSDTLSGLLAPGATRILSFDRTYDFLNTGTYRLTAYINHLISDISYSNDSSYHTVTVGELPAAPSSTPSIRCSPGRLELNAAVQSSLDSLFWFNEPSGGELLNWGATYLTDTLYDSDTLWVESGRGTGGICGPVDNSFGSGTYSSGGGIHFDARQPFKIISVKVLALGSGPRIVELRDDAGNVLQSRTFNLSGGWHRLYLDFDVPEALDLTLALNSSSADLYRNLTNVNYPYKISGVLEMFEGWPTTNRYYYFYDWNVYIPNQQCSSSRTPVYALIGADSTDVFNQVTCDSGSVTFDVQSPEAVNWYDSTGTLMASGNRFTTPLLLATTDYQLEVGGCQRIPVKAEVVARSADPIVAPVNNCGPGQAVLEALSSDPISWYDAPSGGNLYATGLQFTTPYIDSVATFYAVAGTACPSNAVAGTVTITSASPPVVQSASACAPASVTLYAQSPDSLLWYTSATGGTPFASGNSITTPLLSSNVTYYVEANNGCASIRVPVTAHITDIPAPLTADGSRCGAGSLVLSANSIYSLTWWTDSIYGTSVGTGVLFTTGSLGSTTTFYVQADNGTCYSPRIPVVATVEITPPPAVTGSSRCGAGIVSLSATAADPVQWFVDSTGGSPIATGQSFDPAIQSDTVFWVSAGTICQSVRIPVYAMLNAPASDPATGTMNVCAPDSAMLNALPVDPSDPIQWYQTPGGISIGTGNAIAVYFPSTAVSYDTLFYAVAGQSGCESNPVPLNVHVEPRPDSPTIIDGSNCGAGQILLQAFAAYPITWYDVTGNIVANGSSYNAVVNVTTTYYVSAFDGTCMSAQVPITANVLQNPTVSINGPDTLYITPGQLVALSVNPSGGTPPYSYVWSPGGQTSSVINVSAAGTFVVTVTDAAGCSGNDQTVVTVLLGVSENTALDEVLLYPNPSHGRVTVRLAGYTGNRIRIMDATGREVMIYEIPDNSSGSVELDLHTLPKGIYAVCVEYDGKQSVNTLILE